MITNTVVDYIYEMHNERITTWNHQLLSPENLQTYQCNFIVLAIL